jgi:hypothetical protein
MLKEACPNLKVGDTAVLSGESNAASAAGVILNRIYLAKGTTIMFNQPFTVTQDMLDDKILFYAIGSSPIAESYYKNLQIELGSTPTSYEPYKEPKEVQYIYLNEPLKKIGDIADYIDYKNSKIVRNIACYYLNGSENWVLQSINDNQIANFYNTTIVNNNRTTTRCLSNKFVQQTSLIKDTNSEGMLINTGAFYIRLNSDKASNAESFKAWLADNPVLVYAALAEPIEENVICPILPTIPNSTVYEVKTQIQPFRMVATYFSK